jgi:hypothetical protein
MSSDVAATLDPASARVRRGRAIGAMIYAIFGGAWLALWNYRAEPHRWVVYGLIVAAALALMLALGIVTGLLPALTAMRLKIAAALGRS